MSLLPDDLLLRSRIVLREAHLAAIGAVAAESAYLEQQVEIATWRLTGLDEHRGPLLTAGMTLGARIALFRSVGEKLLRTPADSARRGQFQRLLREIEQRIIDRNTVVHGIWASAEGDYLELLRRGPDDLPPATATHVSKRLTVREASADSIQDVARALAELRSRLGTFYAEVWSQAVFEGRLQFE
jgi:hypothetical protein